MAKLTAILLASWLALFAAIGFAQPASPSRESGTIENLGFLAGAWRSSGDDGIVEEMWSRPEGNNLMGAFRWLTPRGDARMFEMLTISAEKDGVIRLRLRHYTPALGAKEDKDKPLTLKLVHVSALRAEFDADKDAGDLERIVYEVKERELQIEVVFKILPQGEVREPLRFTLKKVTM
jgi:hypothetical protein